MGNVSLIVVLLSPPPALSYSAINTRTHASGVTGAWQIAILAIMALGCCFFFTNVLLFSHLKKFIQKIKKCAIPFNMPRFDFNPCHCSTYSTFQLKHPQHPQSINQSTKTQLAQRCGGVHGRWRAQFEDKLWQTLWVGRWGDNFDSLNIFAWRTTQFLQVFFLQTSDYRQTHSFRLPVLSVRFDSALLFEVFKALSVDQWGLFCLFLYISLHVPRPRPRFFKFSSMFQAFQTSRSLKAS